MAKAGRLLASQAAAEGGDPMVSLHRTAPGPENPRGKAQLRVTLPDDSSIAPPFAHGVAFFARPFVQRWIAVCSGMGTGLVGPPRDVHYLSWVSMEGAIGTAWGVPIFHFTGKEIEHSSNEGSSSTASPRQKKQKKNRDGGHRTSNSGKDLRTQEYALVFRFWKDDKSRKGGVPMTGNEYPAGPTGSEVIPFAS